MRHRGHKVPGGSLGECLSKAQLEVPPLVYGRLLRFERFFLICQSVGVFETISDSVSNSVSVSASSFQFQISACVVIRFQHFQFLHFSIQISITFGYRFRNKSDSVHLQPWWWSSLPQGEIGTAWFERKSH